MVEDIRLENLSEDQQAKVRKSLGKYSHMWQGQLGEVNSAKHRIDLTINSQPVFSQPYRAGPQSRKIIQETIDDMCSQGVIEPSQSEWASPVVLVPKSDGSLRFCVDYRRLNALTVKDSYPLPRMDDCLDSLGKAAFFSTLDCNS
eukprot:IDg22762t1